MVQGHEQAVEGFAREGSRPGALRLSVRENEAAIDDCCSLVSTPRPGVLRLPADRLCFGGQGREGQEGQDESSHASG